MKHEGKWDDPNYVFEYDETAKCCLRWKNHKRHKSLIGKECGTLSKSHGHWCVQFRGSPKLAHRVIWEMFNGPLGENDTLGFTDGDRTNNRISNITIIRGEDKNWQDIYLNAGDLKEVFRYKDGMLFWKGDRYSGKCLSKKYAEDGDALDCAVDKDGYLRTKIVAYDPKGCPSIHRLVYEYFNGAIPDGMQVDHIDGDVTNNRIENLRCVSHAANSRNRRIGNSSTGILGVTTKLDDKGKPLLYRACWKNVDGSSGSKSYSCVIYGEQMALELATKAREEAIKRLNDVLGNEGYHENHGKRA